MTYKTRYPESTIQSFIGDFSFGTVDLRLAYICATSVHTKFVQGIE